MGRYYWDKKDTVDDCKSISISLLRKYGYLCSNRPEQICWTDSITGKETASIGIIVSITEAEKFVRFYYTVGDRYTGKKTDYDYKVQLTTTPCNFGGVRYWFICPSAIKGACGRRVGTLFLAPGREYFGCRHCCNLSYASRNEPRFARFGGIGYPLKAERQLKELYKSIKRWTWRGRPTRKVRKLQNLKQRREQGILSFMSEQFLQ